MPSHGDDEALITIDGLGVLQGRLRPRALGMVMEWASIHQRELRQVWEQALAHEPLDRIEPLP